MNATNKLLDKWIEWRSLKLGADFRQAAIARELGVRSTSISNYRAGTSQAAPHVISKMARDLGENEAAWMALVESERAKDAEDRKTWARLARQLGAAAAVFLMLSSVALPAPANTGEGYGEVGIMRSLIGRGWCAGSVVSWTCSVVHSFGLSTSVAPRVGSSSCWPVIAMTFAHSHPQHVPELSMTNIASFR